jgi:probable addiction module antidote protein
MVTTTRWDVTEHLDTDDAVAAYIDAALEDGDADVIKAALSDVARARGMSAMAEKVGVSRAGLYRALGEDGNPSLSTVLAIMKALGVKLGAKVAA